MLLLIPTICSATASANGLIAAIALENILSLVSRDVRDYENLGATYINPWNAA